MNFIQGHMIHFKFRREENVGGVQSHIHLLSSSPSECQPNPHTSLSLWMMIGCRLAGVMTSQLGLVAVSESVQDGVSSVEGIADGRLNSAPPTLQLRTTLQDVSASTHGLLTDTHTHTVTGACGVGGLINISEDQTDRPASAHRWQAGRLQWRHDHRGTSVCKETSTPVCPESHRAERAHESNAPRPPESQSEPGGAPDTGGDRDVACSNSCVFCLLNTCRLHYPQCTWTSNRCETMVCCSCGGYRVRWTRLRMFIRLCSAALETLKCCCCFKTHLLTGTNLQDKDFGSVWSCVAVMPGGVLVHPGSSRRFPWIPVVRDIVPVGQVLQDGIAATHTGVTKIRAHRCDVRYKTKVKEENH